MKTKEYIEKLVSEIVGNGCTIPPDLLTHNLQNLVDFAKAEQVIEETKRWADGKNKFKEARIGEFVTEPKDNPEDNRKFGWPIPDGSGKDNILLGLSAGESIPPYQVQPIAHNPNIGIDNPTAKGQINTGGLGYKALDDRNFGPGPLVFIGYNAGTVCNQHNAAEPEFIEPSQMVKGEWYIVETKGFYKVNYSWLIKNNGIVRNQINCIIIVDLENGVVSGNRSCNVDLCHAPDAKSIRKATREEVLKYFPNEFDKQPHEHNIN